MIKEEIISLFSDFNLKKSLIHSRRIVQIIPIGDAIEVLVDSKPLLPSQLLVFFTIVYLLRRISGLKSCSIQSVFFRGSLMIGS